MAEDRTWQFVECLTAELERFAEIKDDFVEVIVPLLMVFVRTLTLSYATQEFTDHDYEHIADGWNTKLVRCAAGDQKWGLFQAHKRAEDA